MKVSWLFLCGLWSALCAEEQDKIISQKVIIQDGVGFYCFSDDSIWKVTRLEPRSRTLSEWWNNEQIVPENLVCTVNDFYIGLKVKIIPKNEFSLFYDNFAKNKAILANCSHIIVNTNTNKCLFATFLTHQAAFEDIRKEAAAYGYSLGYKEGNSSGYDEGYYEGYRQGRNH